MNFYLVSKWSSLAVRERALSAIVVFIAVMALVELAVYEPLINGLDILRKELNVHHSESALISKQRVDLLAELSSLSRPEVHVRDSTTGFGKDLWTSDQAAVWVNQTQEAFGESLGRLSVSSAGSTEVGYRIVYAHPVVLEAVASWEKMAAYMDNAKRMNALRVERFNLISLPDGRVKLELKFRVLSNEQFWKDVTKKNSIVGGLK